MISRHDNVSNIAVRLVPIDWVMCLVGVGCLLYAYL